jgi:hypothetical protein
MRVGDPLGMPLNSCHPIGIARPLDRFNYTVSRVRDHAQIAARFQN